MLMIDRFEINVVPISNVLNLSRLIRQYDLSGSYFLASIWIKLFWINFSLSEKLAYLTFLIFYLPTEPSLCLF